VKVFGALSTRLNDTAMVSEVFLNPISWAIPNWLIILLLTQQSLSYTGSMWVNA
jgi:hypothetical protein